MNAPHKVGARAHQTLEPRIADRFGEEITSNAERRSSLFSSTPFARLRQGDRWLSCTPS
jgi:hypothetical protein